MKLLLILAILLFFDYFYLGVFNHEFYKPIITKTPVNMASGLVAWAFLAWSIDRASSVQDAAKDALVIYAVYNFTNFAIMKDYPARIVLGDTVWGVFLCSLTKWIVQSITGA
jgi:uncharacterized membrane protein